MLEENIILREEVNHLTERLQRILAKVFLSFQLQLIKCIFEILNFPSLFHQSHSGI